MPGLVAAHEARGAGRKFEEISERVAASAEEDLREVVHVNAADEFVN